MFSTPKHLQSLCANVFGPELFLKRLQKSFRRPANVSGPAKFAESPKLLQRSCADVLEDLKVEKWKSEKVKKWKSEKSEKVRSEKGKGKRGKVKRKKAKGK